MPSQSKEDTYAYYYHTNYIRNARAIAIAWAIFTFCFAIIMVVVFVQPYWIGDDADALGTGYFGLYSGCFSLSLRGNLQCRRNIFDFSQITGYTTLIVATVFVGIAVIFTLLSIVLMLLFLCKKPSTATVFYICGTLQILTGVCLLIGILVYPAGWSDHQGMKALCGKDLSYTNTDGCQLRWVFYLAIIAVFDAIILGILAFILANKQDKLHVDMHFSDYYQPKGSKYEKKKSKKGSLRSNLFKSDASYANEAYDHDGQTRPNGKAATLDRRSIGSAESASAADIRTRSPSRNSAAHSEGRATPSNSGSLSKRSGSGRGSDPDYASVEPRAMRSKSNGSASNGSVVNNDDGVSHHSTRSARSTHSAHSAHSGHSAHSAHSGHSSHSQKSGKSGSRAHDVVM